MFTETIPYHVALWAGITSFFTPCVLPLIPAYFSFITGFSLEELTAAPPSEIRVKVVFSTLAYVLGFSVIFVLLGASAWFLGNLILEYKDVIVKIGAVVIILFGVHLTGIVRFRGLEFEKRLHVGKKPLGYVGTFLVGMAFGAGWSPCIGPLLGSILIIAGSQDTVWQGVGLLGVYAAGLALPFILISIFINFLLVFMKKAVRAVKYVNKAAGVILILVGAFLLTDTFFAFTGV